MRPSVVRPALRLLVAAALACPACKSLTPVRSPECNDIVNRCMQSCSDGPEALSPANQTVANEHESHTARSGCEDRCQSKCKR
jgi:hypothetical protein